MAFISNHFVHKAKLGVCWHIVPIIDLQSSFQYRGKDQYPCDCEKLKQFSYLLAEWSTSVIICMYSSSNRFSKLELIIPVFVISVNRRLISKAITYCNEFGTNKNAKFISIASNKEIVLTCHRESLPQLWQTKVFPLLQSYGSQRSQKRRN